jgi:peptidoglycan/xylan/chitin deacetylase (PgdA/CDA1 family)
MLVDFNTFETDLKNNFAELQKFGIQPEKAGFFMPPYEWYNRQIVDWSRNLGLNVINFTPGTGTNADYTTPEMANYKSSEALMERLLKFENKESLNGAILLIHPGTEKSRTDKFYMKLEELIKTLKVKGYQFKSFKY